MSKTYRSQFNMGKQIGIYPMVDMEDEELRS